jgi:hypothetical protein
MTNSSHSESNKQWGFNRPAAAELFKLEVESAFNKWNASRPMRTGFPHASGILAPDSDFCMRKLVLLAAYPEQAVRPEPKPWDTHQNMVFKSGWSLHEKYQELLHHYSTVAEFEGLPELDLTHFHGIRLVHFSPDVVQKHLRRPMPLEIKGYKHSTFEALDESGDPPKDAHKQVNFYMLLLELSHGLILVEDKDTQHIKVWCVEYDDELAEPYKARTDDFKSSYNLVQAGGPPPERKCSSKDDRLAQKCEMRDWCFSHR